MRSLVARRSPVARRSLATGRWSLVAGCFLVTGALTLAASPVVAGSLIEASETAALVVQGRVEAVRRVDRHGLRAEVRVAEVVAGASAPERVVIAWEELSASRTPRFADGETLLLVLEPLPTASLWRRRFATEPGPVLAVSGRGEAYLRAPDEATLRALGGYLRLSTEARHGADGTAALASMVRVDALALQALARLDALWSAPAEPSSGGALDEAERRRHGRRTPRILAEVLTDERRPLPVRAAIIDLAAKWRLPELRPALQALATAPSPLEANALDAIAALDGALDAQQAVALTRRGDPALRAVGAQHLRGPEAEKRLPGLARSDPSPLVRRAAADALVRSGTQWGMQSAAATLGDPDPAVRAGASQSIAAAGANAVPFLEAALLNDGDSAPGAIAALSLMGPPGRASLRTAATHHRDPRIRALADLALGHGPGHRH